MDGAFNQRERGIGARQVPRPPGAEPDLPDRDSALSDAALSQPTPGVTRLYKLQTPHARVVRWARRLDPLDEADAVLVVEDVVEADLLAARVLDRRAPDLSAGGG